MKPERISNAKPLLESILPKCMECGIDPQVFLKEKLLELEERKRILLVPTRYWFNRNRRTYNDFAARILNRQLTDEEKYGSSSLQEVIERRLNPESREALSIDVGLKRKLLQEANRRCVVCGTLLDLDTVYIDHIIPLIEGGANHPLNLQPLCWECNAGKSDYFEETVEAAARPWYEQRGRLVGGEVRLTPIKRFCVLVRDGSTCRRCGATSRDHSLKVLLRVQERDGGQAVYDNLATICEKCEWGHSTL